MLTHETASASHAGDEQFLAERAKKSAHLATALTGVTIAKAEAQANATLAPPLRWRADEPQVGATSLTELVQRNSWMRVGDVVYVIEARRHLLTHAEIDAARSAIGSAT